MFCLLSLLVMVATSVAGDDARSRQPEKSTPSVKIVKSRTQTDKEVELTGSRIKGVVRRNGLITDGPSQVVVIDRGTIERSGGTDLKQGLGLQGIH